MPTMRLPIVSTRRGESLSRLAVKSPATLIPILKYVLRLHEPYAPSLKTDKAKTLTMAPPFAPNRVDSSYPNGSVVPSMHTQLFIGSLLLLLALRLVHGVQRYRRRRTIMSLLLLTCLLFLPSTNTTTTNTHHPQHDNHLIVHHLIVHNTKTPYHNDKANDCHNSNLSRASRIWDRGKERGAVVLPSSSVLPLPIEDSFALYCRVATAFEPLSLSPTAQAQALVAWPPSLLRLGTVRGVAILSPSGADCCCCCCCYCRVAVILSKALPKSFPWFKPCYRVVAHSSCHAQRRRIIYSQHKSAFWRQSLV